MTKTPGRLSSRIALLALTLAVAPPGRLAAAQGCQGDLVPNGAVNGADLGVLLSYWGPRTADPFSVASDIDGNGDVNGADLGLLLSGWGNCPATISSVSPSQGCLLGGTVVTITGTWLGSVASVTVGGLPCSGVTVDSATSLRATVPAGASGAADVAVTTLGGTTVSASAFTYREMVVSAISPNGGSPAGGTAVTITGECLGNVTAVTVGQAPASAVTVVDASTVTAITPPGPFGAAEVAVSGSKGSTPVPGGFRYLSVPSWATLVEAQPDPAVVTDHVLRAAIEATGLAWRVRDSGTQIEMLLVPPGTFQMGCIMGSNQYGCRSIEQPVHQVTLTSAFYLGRYEVTQAQWTARMGSNPSSFQASSGYPDSGSRPVERVSWNTIQGYLAATGMRLPTEAEWEYACRAGTQTPFYNGSMDDNTVGALAWYAPNSGSQTHAVGGKAANGFGLHDLLGNVSEWVNDRYGTYQSGTQTDPSGPASGKVRLSRGGAWNFDTFWVRSTSRDGVTPSDVYNFVGFRVARNP
jgi:formylglycine-generating enzyme required for sulfatase activity